MSTQRARCDIVLAGVGGRGVLSLGAVLGNVAREAGLRVSISEVHGMAQRGGSVFAHLRISDDDIHSTLIARGTADALIAAEPLEGLRCLDLLAPDGIVVASIEAHRNIPDYPEPEELLASLRALPRVILVDTAALARQAGSKLSANLVLAGAASHLLPIDEERCDRMFERVVAAAFGSKGERVVESNLTAYRLGKEAVLCPAV